MNKIKIDNYYKPESKTLRLDETNLNQTDINAMQVLLRKNQELKEKLDKYENPEDMTLMMMWCTEKVKDENQALKKQVEEYKDNYNCLLEQKEQFEYIMSKQVDYQGQRKEFIKYLEDKIYSIEPKGTSINYNCEYDSEEDYVMAVQEQSRLNTLKEILQKYKETIGVKND